jgi:hypothetical protein
VAALEPGQVIWRDHSVRVRCYARRYVHDDDRHQQFVQPQLGRQPRALDEVAGHIDVPECSANVHR